MAGTPALYAARPSVLLDGADNAELSGGLISARVEDSAEGCARCEASFGNWGEPNGTVGYRYLDRSLLDFGKTLALRMGAGDGYTEGRDTLAWLKHLYELSRVKSAEAGVTIPPFDDFWQAGIAQAQGENRAPVMLADFRADPAAHPLKTPSGKIEIFSEKIASFGYDDCPGHATWLEPIEWLGSKTAERYPLHMLSDQPTDKLHSQLDHSPHSRATKIKGRQPITLHHADAAARGIEAGDLVRVFNDRGACLAAARLSDRIRRGVVRLSTGAWFDPADVGSNRPLEKHGNPNVLTLDIGASKLSQGCSAQTCLVEVERFDGPAPAVTAHRLPEFAKR